MKRRSKNQRPNKRRAWLPRTGRDGAARTFRALGKCNGAITGLRAAAVDYANRTSASQAAFVYNVAERTIARWRTAARKAAK